MTEDLKIAYGLILAVVGLLFFLIRNAKKPTGIKSILKAFLALLVIYMIGVSFGTHMCKSGQPIKIITIYSFLAFFWCLLIPSKRMRLSGLTLIAILTAYHSGSFASLVHVKGFTGNPNQQIIWDRFREREIESAKAYLLAEPPAVDAVIQEGWARDIENELVREHILTLELSEWKDVEAYTTWHTFFTGLYRTREYPLGIWTSGGSWDETLKTLQWKRH